MNSLKFDVTEYRLIEVVRVRRCRNLLEDFWESGFALRSAAFDDLTRRYGLTPVTKIGGLVICKGLSIFQANNRCIHRS
jgi:hypothetical protein